MVHSRNVVICRAIETGMEARAIAGTIHGTLLTRDQAIRQDEHNAQAWLRFSRGSVNQMAFFEARGETPRYDLKGILAPGRGDGCCARKYAAKGGELAGIRTQDPRLKRALLYQLSYELV